MLKENTRKAIETDLMLALELPQEKDEDVLMVRAARKIFHTEWSNEDMQTMVEFIRKNGTSNMYWPNDTDLIFDQIFRMIDKATDYQIVIWLKEIWGADRALDYIVSCEQKF